MGADFIPVASYFLHLLRMHFPMKYCTILLATLHHTVEKLGNSIGSMLRISLIQVWWLSSTFPKAH